MRASPSGSRRWASPTRRCHAATCAARSPSSGKQCRRSGESPFKLFYTRAGASPFASDINPVGRSIVRFNVRAAVRALESFTTGTLDVWTVPSEDQLLVFAPRANKSGVVVAGGGAPLIIPRSFAVLRVVKW